MFSNRLFFKDCHLINFSERRAFLQSLKSLCCLVLRGPVPPTKERGRVFGRLLKGWLTAVSPETHDWLTQTWRTASLTCSRDKVHFAAKVRCGLCDLWLTEGFCLYISSGMLNEGDLFPFLAILPIISLYPSHISAQQTTTMNYSRHQKMCIDMAKGHGLFFSFLGQMKVKSDGKF